MGNRSRQGPREYEEPRPGDPDGPPFFGLAQHSPYTVEGRIEQAGKFARGVRNLPPARKPWVLAVLALVVLGPWVIFLVAMVMNAD